jgi:SAM-dependent methyltransferase
MPEGTETDHRRQRLVDFVAWCDQHITGDEKGQAQIFLDRFFRAFGHDGLLEAGGEAEVRIRKAREDGGGTAFADCVWKPHVLIEMKKRGEDLTRHYRQAFDYWTRLAPGRPHYVILCNFDQFHVYDFDSAQFDQPMDRVALADLPDRYGPLAFLFPTHEEPVFGNDNEKVTREAAARLATLFNKLKVRQDVGRETAQRFILQLLVALFAEDIGLLSPNTIERICIDATTPEQAHDLFLDLFRAMNEPQARSAGRFKDIRYFNGGLYAQPVSVELSRDELNLIFNPKARGAAGVAAEDWSQVRPEIFGTIFEQTMETGDEGGLNERHAYGAHFTSAVDIMRIVQPTITDPWETLIARADTVGQLEQLHYQMQNFRVLDPACGSGNFLYLAYRELKRLEHQLFEKLTRVSRAADKTGRLGFVTTKQFFGMDINPFAVELAKVTMMLSHKLAIDELHSDEDPLPLDNLDANISCCDALIQPGETADAIGGFMQTPWPDADVIIGNPPFLGAKRLKPERGADYVNAVRKLYPDVPGMADYCVYWFRRSHDELPVCTPDQPFRGRAGLVGTQNIRNNKSREGGLDHIVESGVIVEAVDNQPWSGEANVHVSIANWVKIGEAQRAGSSTSPDAGAGDGPARTEVSGRRAEQLIIPAKKKLWFKIDPPKGKKRKRGSGPASKQFELNARETDFINPALSDQTDVTGAKVLQCNRNPKVTTQGVTPGHSGFIITPELRQRMKHSDQHSNEVVFPYIVGDEFLGAFDGCDRFIVDFKDCDLLDARAFTAAFEHVQQAVLPDIQQKADGEPDDVNVRKAQLDRWWQLWRNRADLLTRIEALNARYIACSRVTKRPIFVFLDSSIRPGDAVQAFCFDDDYSFGLLQSDAHWQWFVSKCSKLKSDFRYTPPSVFDTFPWPQGPSERDVEAVAEAGRAVRRVRGEALAKIKGGLRAVYRTLELPGKNPLKDAHAALDAAVLAAYGFSAKKDLLAQLLALNLDVADRIEKGEDVTAPGVPSGYPDPAKLITNDCIQP